MAINLEDLHVGSVVRLISGSPKMAVTGVGDGNMVKVVWWSDRLGVCSDEFEAEVLTFPRVRRDPEAPATDAVDDED